MAIVVPRPVSKAVIAEVYEDLRPLIEKTAAEFASLYRRDPVETLSDANLHFLEAYHGFDRSRGVTLEQRLQFILWRRLTDGLRQDQKRKNRFPTGLAKKNQEEDRPLVELVADVDHPEFSRADFERELTGDARIVLKLILDKSNLDMLVHSQAALKGSRIAKHLKRYLQNSLSWSMARITESFGEIRRALA